jgi:hypothetical protein
MTAPAPRTFDVTYADGTVVKVKRVKTALMDDLLELQQVLVAHFSFHSALLGDLLKPSSKQVWADLEKTAKMLPVLGSDKPLDLEQLKDDPDQICRIFFTATTDVDDEDGGLRPAEGGGYLPSEISKLHGFNFFGQRGVMAIAFPMAVKWREEDLAKRKQELEQELETVKPETPPTKTRKKPSPTVSASESSPEPSNTTEVNPPSNSGTP